MRAVVQRVKKAGVIIDGRVIAEINKGLLVLVGFEKNEQQKEIEKIAQKILKLRVFPDKLRNMNLSVQDIGGEILIVSQFTLLADTSCGNRPSFVKALEPEKALFFYHLFIQEIKKSGLKVATGDFGKYMQVKLINDGPVTIIY